MTTKAEISTHPDPTIRGTVLDDTVTTKPCTCACGNKHYTPTPTCAAKCNSEGTVVRCQWAEGHTGPHFRLMGMTSFVEWPRTEARRKTKTSPTSASQQKKEGQE